MIYITYLLIIGLVYFSLANWSRPKNLLRRSACIFTVSLQNLIKGSSSELQWYLYTLKEEEQKRKGKEKKKTLHWPFSFGSYGKNATEEAVSFLWHIFLLLAGTFSNLHWEIWDAWPFMHFHDFMGEIKSFLLCHMLDKLKYRLSDWDLSPCNEWKRYQ